MYTTARSEQHDLNGVCSEESSTWGEGVCVCLNCPGLLPAPEFLITTVPERVYVCGVCVCLNKLREPISVMGISMATPEQVPDVMHHISKGWKRHIKLAFFM